MDKILQLNIADSDITVQCGIGYIDLNEYLNKFNLWFPLDPGPGISMISIVFIILFKLISLSKIIK